MPKNNEIVSTFVEVMHTGRNLWPLFFLGHGVYGCDRI